MLCLIGKPTSPELETNRSLLFECIECQIQRGFPVDTVHNTNLLTNLVIGNVDIDTVVSTSVTSLTTTTTTCLSNSRSTCIKNCNM